MKKRFLLIPLLVFGILVGFTELTSRKISGFVTGSDDGLPLPGVKVSVKGTSKFAQTDKTGHYSISVPDGKPLLFSIGGYTTKEVKPGKSHTVNIVLLPDSRALTEVVVTGNVGRALKQMAMSVSAASIRYDREDMLYQRNTESYNSITENRFHEATKTPLSTFSIDVDAASYSNVRRFINYGQLPPVDAVRIEELINYFKYEYPEPRANDPVSISSEISAAPWNVNHKLVKIGLKGRTIPTDNLPASNLVFLIDVSGSMSPANRLPLVKSSIKLLVDQLRPQDKVAIVVYAGAAGQVLASTPGDKKELIKTAIDNLNSGGSTAGGAGIRLAYKIALENFAKKGNNRVILATDGDFNVGVSSDSEMEHLIEEKRQSGVFLTVLGYGMGNYKDSKLETLADKGNGNYAYIDDFTEARKVLVNEFGGTLFTIAKDVKLQLEFNPAKVQAYRLLGYENRMLKKEDFNNDKKDAGELGSGHTVTALYEIIPVGVKSSFIESVDDLKYQKNPATPSGNNNKDLLTLKLRYKEPEGIESKMLIKEINDHNVSWKQASDDFRFAAAIAGYGMLLRKSEFRQSASFDKVIEWAQGSLGADIEGYRNEFLKLVKSSALLSKESLSSSEK